MTELQLPVVGDEEPPLQLPDLQDAVLNVPQVGAYLDELQSLGCTVQVRVKSASQDRPRNFSLSEIAEALERGDIHSAQLRYRFESRPWVDTLMRTTTGIRLVRLDLDAVPRH